MSIEQIIEPFESQIYQGVENEGIGSIAVAVVQGNEQIWAKGFGWADKEKNIEANSETIYRVGSISKCFTGVLLLQLCEQGVVRLDDLVESHFPEIKQLDGYADHEPITLRQLGSHTAGLVREPDLVGAASGPIEGWEDKVIASIPTTSFEYAPGVCFSYSNIGYGILGLVLSRAVRQPFMDRVTESIIDPLGLEMTSFILTPEMWSHLATGYVVDRDGVANSEVPFKEHAGRGYKVPNGGIYSTVGDLGRFIAAQVGVSPVQVLSDESREEIQKNQTPGAELPAYGLGFRIQLGYKDRPFFGHGGSVAGYNASLVFEPESKLGVVMLRNYDRSRVGIKELSTQLLQKLVAEI